MEKMEERLERMRNELVQPALKFDEHKVENTIVFFGSARIKPEEDAHKAMREVEVEFDHAKRRTEQMWERMDAASNDLFMSRYYTAADELAYKFAKWSENIANPKDRFYICTGGGPGIMGAANKGAHRAGAKNIGLSIDIPFENTNPYMSPELSHEFNYFLLRKFWFFYLAKAIIIFPGGLGTLDEAFEGFTLMKTRKIRKYVPVIFFGSKYWKRILNFEPMIQHGTIDKDTLNMFRFMDDVDEVFKFVTNELEEHYVGQGCCYLPENN